MFYEEKANELTASNSGRLKLKRIEIEIFLKQRNKQMIEQVAILWPSFIKQNKRKQ